MKIAIDPGWTRNIPYNPRCDQKGDFSLVARKVLVGEQLAKVRKFRQSGNLYEVCAFVVADQSRQNLCFSILQRERGRSGARANLIG